MSDDAISALKHFRCGACDRLKQPPSKRKVAVNHAETFNDTVFMDVNFWKITFKESSRVKTTLKVLNIVDYASRMHIAIQIADQSAETIWRAFATGWMRWAGSPRCLRVDPHMSQIARGFFDKAEGRGIFVEPTSVLSCLSAWTEGTVADGTSVRKFRIILLACLGDDQSQHGSPSCPCLIHGTFRPPSHIS